MCLQKLLTMRAATHSKYVLVPSLYHLAHTLVSVGTSRRFGSYTNGVTFVPSSMGAWAMIPTAVWQKCAMGSLPSTAWHALRLG
jgi:hypothetical protein